MELKHPNVVETLEYLVGEYLLTMYIAMYITLRYLSSTFYWGEKVEILLISDAIYESKYVGYHYTHVKLFMYIIIFFHLYRGT